MKRERIPKSEIEKRFSFLKEYTQFANHYWDVSDDYLHFFRMKEDETVYSGMIKIFNTPYTLHKPMWIFNVENEEERIIYKKLEKTPLWFEGIYQSIFKTHRQIMEEFYPEQDHIYWYAPEVGGNFWIYENEKVGKHEKGRFRYE